MPQRTAPIAFRYGAIFGAIITVIGGGNTLVQNIRQGIGPSGDGLVLVSCVVFFAVIGLLLEAGNMAAQQNGRLATGTWAGAIAAAIPAFVLSIIATIQVSSDRNSASDLHGAERVIVVITGILIAAAFSMVFAGGIGAGLGAFGALLGRSRYRKAHPQAYPAYPPYGANPGMPPSPYPAYPPYPPYAGYPPTGQYPPSDTLAPQYGQAPVYPPPPPGYPRPVQPEYPPDDTDSRAGRQAPDDTEPPTARW